MQTTGNVHNILAATLLAGALLFSGCKTAGTDSSSTKDERGFVTIDDQRRSKYKDFAAALTEVNPNSDFTRLLAEVRIYIAELEVFLDGYVRRETPRYNADRVNDTLTKMSRARRLLKPMTAHAYEEDIEDLQSLGRDLRTSIDRWERRGGPGGGGNGGGSGGRNGQVHSVKLGAFVKTSGSGNCPEFVLSSSGTPEDNMVYVRCTDGSLGAGFKCNEHNVCECNDFSFPFKLDYNSDGTLTLENNQSTRFYKHAGRMEASPLRGGFYRLTQGERCPEVEVSVNLASEPASVSFTCTNRSMSLGFHCPNAGRHCTSRSPEFPAELNFGDNDSLTLDYYGRATYRFSHP